MLGRDLPTTAQPLLSELFYSLIEFPGRPLLTSVTLMYLNYQPGRNWLLFDVFNSEIIDRHCRSSLVLSACLC